MDSPRPRTRRRESRDQPELRRSSWTKQKSFTPQHPKQHEREYRESESSNELAVDADEYWRSSRDRRSRSPIDRHANSSSNDQSNGGSDEDRMSNDDDKTLATVRDDMSDRSSTPVPSVEAPLKPERLNYKEKFVLRGHLRGVAAVQFSPDCSMIASGGIFPNL
jgi:COMPASS component SWD3